MTQHGKKKLFFFSDGRKKSSAEEKDSFFFPTEEKDFSVKTAVPGLRGRLQLLPIATHTIVSISQRWCAPSPKKRCSNGGLK